MSAQPVTIVICTEATRLVVELPAPEGSWNLAVDLSEADGGSQLVFTQRLAQSDDAASIGPGWHYYLDRLAAVVAGAPVVARAQGIEDVLVTCDDENAASAKTIERCGGVLDSVVDGPETGQRRRRYWIR